MKSCVLKSYPNGITVILSNEIDFEELLVEVQAKFQEAAPFFKKAKLAVSFEGRELARDEEERLLDAIEQNSEIQVICVVGKDEESNIAYLKAIEKLACGQEDRNSCKFYQGSLKDGQVLETKDSVVILGDVNPGCVVLSAKDIIILGGLYGEAHAGVDGDATRFVFALEMSFERLKIGNLRYRMSQEKRSFWPVKPKVEPKIAMVEDETIVLKPYQKNTIENR